MSFYEYPAILKYADDCCYVRFPDIENCFTDGDTREEAIDMACDVLPLMLCDYEDRNLDIPKPSAREDITIAPDEEIVFVKADTALYRRRYLKESKKTRVVAVKSGCHGRTAAAKRSPAARRSSKKPRYNTAIHCRVLNNQADETDADKELYFKKS